MQLKTSSDEEESEDDEPRVRRKKGKGKEDEEEAEYETSGRPRWAGKARPNGLGQEDEDDRVDGRQVPIKLPTGEVQLVEARQDRRREKEGASAASPDDENENDQGVDSADDGSDDGRQAARMANQKGKFGRMGVAKLSAKTGGRTRRSSRRPRADCHPSVLKFLRAEN